MPQPTRPKLAIVITSYGKSSHGVCYATKFMEGKQYDDHFEPARCDVVAIHQMQITDDDVGVKTAKDNHVPSFHSVAAALCRGGDELAVDGVVVVGEHGAFPFNDQGQHMYPRRELFDQVVGVFRQAGRVVPVFNDKHMSWNWAWSKYMWRTIQELKIPWMAGSSLPYAKYVPIVPLPRGQKIDHLVAVGYASLDSYGIHAIETGQFVVEQRAGGEVGVKSVQCLQGADVWEAHRQGMWPRDVAAAALAAVQTPKGRPQDYSREVYAINVEYRDGQKMTVLMPNGYCKEFAFAYRATGQDRIVAASYELDPVPRLKHFSATVRSIEEMFLSGRPTEPGERTYLTTGILWYAEASLRKGSAKLETPDLDIAYRPPQRPESWKEVLR